MLLARKAATRALPLLVVIWAVFVIFGGALRLVVIFHFHRSPDFSAGLLRQTSGPTGRETGVFGTCSPLRPNPIGMSVLEVLGIRGASIDVKRLDMLDGTPVLDIKPHVDLPSGQRHPRDGARVAEACLDGVSDRGW